MRRPNPPELVERVLAGDRTALARLLSAVEQGGTGASQTSALVWPRGGQTYSVGITGAPGAGKSTLTDGLVGVIRKGGDEVAVLAIDPSSPYTGGAILGDRVRMGSHFTDPGVFIRSMATRGHLGGLALAAPGALRVLDAAGFPWTVVETVGVGQVEVEIAGAADTTVVVVNPGWGDGIQANKAGLMEIADVFVINKADRPGASETERDLRSMLELSGLDHDDWWPPIVRASATEGMGLDDVWAAVGQHRERVERTGELARRRELRLRVELQATVTRLIEARVISDVDGSSFEDLLTAVVERRTDPLGAAEQLVQSLLR